MIIWINEGYIEVTSKINENEGYIEVTSKINENEGYIHDDKSRKKYGYNVNQSSYKEN
jgi:hypothetical protein